MSKRPFFETLTITQGPDGQMSVSGQYRVKLVSDSNEQEAVSVGIAAFSITHEELLANPDFAEGYRIIRDLARAGLQSTHPEFVTE